MSWPQGRFSFSGFKRKDFLQPLPSPGVPLSPQPWTVYAQSISRTGPEPISAAALASGVGLIEKGHQALTAEAFQHSCIFQDFTPRINSFTQVLYNTRFCFIASFRIWNHPGHSPELPLHAETLINTHFIVHINVWTDLCVCPRWSSIWRLQVPPVFNYSGDQSGPGRAH